MPSFSPHAAAGSSTCGAAASVSLCATFSDTTNRSSFFSASRIALARGSDTAGLVAITHSALISPRSIASNICTALRPSCSAMRGAFQNRRTRSTFARRERHVRGELIGEPADLAAAHGVGLAGQRERPHAGPADAAGGEMAIDDGIDLVGALRRLVHALREAGDCAARLPNRSKKRTTSRSARPVAAAAASRCRRDLLGARKRLGEAAGVCVRYRRDRARRGRRDERAGRRTARCPCRARSAATGQRPRR